MTNRCHALTWTAILVLACVTAIVVWPRFTFAHANPPREELPAPRLLQFDEDLRLVSFPEEPVWPAIMREAALLSDEQLIALLRQDDFMPGRTIAALGAGYSARRSLVPALVEALKTEPVSSYKEQIIQALSWIGDPSSAEHIFPYLQSDNPFLHVAAYNALQFWLPRSEYVAIHESRIKQDPDSARPIDIEILVQMGDLKQLPVLRPLLSSRKPEDIRLGVIRSIEQQFALPTIDRTLDERAEMVGRVLDMIEDSPSIEDIMKQQQQ